MIILSLLGTFNLFWPFSCHMSLYLQTQIIIMINKRIYLDLPWYAWKTLYCKALVHVFLHFKIPDSLIKMDTLDCKDWMHINVFLMRNCLLCSYILLLQQWRCSVTWRYYTFNIILSKKMIIVFTIFCVSLWWNL